MGWSVKLLLQAYALDEIDENLQFAYYLPEGCSRQIIFVILLTINLVLLFFAKIISISIVQHRAKLITTHITPCITPHNTPHNTLHITPHITPHITQRSDTPHRTHATHLPAVRRVPGIVARCPGQLALERCQKISE